MKEIVIYILRWIGTYNDLYYLIQQKKFSHVTVQYERNVFRTCLNYCHMTYMIFDTNTKKSNRSTYFNSFVIFNFIITSGDALTLQQTSRSNRGESPWFILVIFNSLFKRIKRVRKKALWLGQCAYLNKIFLLQDAWFMASWAVWLAPRPLPRCRRLHWIATGQSSDLWNHYVHWQQYGLVY